MRRQGTTLRRGHSGAAKTAGQDPKMTSYKIRLAPNRPRRGADSSSHFDGNFYGNFDRLSCGYLYSSPPQDPLFRLRRQRISALSLYNHTVSRACSSGSTDLDVWLEAWNASRGSLKPRLREHWNEAVLFQTMTLGPTELQHPEPSFLFSGRRTKIQG